VSTRISLDKHEPFKPNSTSGRANSCPLVVGTRAPRTWILPPLFPVALFKQPSTQLRTGPCGLTESGPISLAVRWSIKAVDKANAQVCNQPFILFNLSIPKVWERKTCEEGLLTCPPLLIPSLSFDDSIPIPYSVCMKSMSYTLCTPNLGDALCSIVGWFMDSCRRSFCRRRFCTRELSLSKCIASILDVSVCKSPKIQTIAIEQQPETRITSDMMSI
jgi:hypothetical protein